MAWLVSEDLILKKRIEEVLSLPDFSQCIHLRSIEVGYRYDCAANEFQEIILCIIVMIISYTPAT